MASRWGLLGLLAAMLVVSCARGSGHDKAAATQSLVEAEARLADLRQRLAEREKLAALLQGRSCKAEDDKCRVQKTDHAHKLRRRQEEARRDKANSTPYERVRLEAQLEPPLGVKLASVRFLPIHNANSSRLMHRYLVATDTHTSVHLFNSDGEHLLAYDTGHTAPITSLAVDFRPATEYRLLTGSRDGEVRVHALPGPVRPKKTVRNAPKNSTAAPQNDTAPVERAAEGAEVEQPSNVTRYAHGQMTWAPKFSLISAFYPARAEPVRGLSRRHHGVDLTDKGERAIAAAEFVFKGRSYNVLITDDIGRLSLHIKNGSISASVQLPTETAPRCAVSIKTVCAICTDQGMFFYETKERRLLQQTCTRLSAGTDEGLPDKPPTPPPAKKPPTNASTNASENVNAGGGGWGGGRKTRAAPNPVNTSFVSFVQDQASEIQAYAGTEDGCVAMLQVRGEKNRIRCTLLHEVRLSLDPGPVHVTAVKGFVLAAVSTKSGTHMTVLNTTTSSRTLPPELSMRLPLAVDGKKHLDITSDRHLGLGLIVGDAGVIVQTKLDYNPPSEWDMSMLNMLRHPLLLGAVAMFFMWQMKKKKKGDDVEAMLREEKNTRAQTGKGRWH